MLKDFSTKGEVTKGEKFQRERMREGRKYSTRLLKDSLSKVTQEEKYGGEVSVGTKEKKEIEDISSSLNVIYLELRQVKIESTFHLFSAKGTIYLVLIFSD